MLIRAARGARTATAFHLKTARPPGNANRRGASVRRGKSQYDSRSVQKLEICRSGEQKFNYVYASEDVRPQRRCGYGVHGPLRL